MEIFEFLPFESEVYDKLKETERQAKDTDERYSSKEVLAEVERMIEAAQNI